MNVLSSVGRPNEPGGNKKDRLEDGPLIDASVNNLLHQHFFRPKQK